MKIISVVGTRPQFIKCALLLKELRKYHQVITVNTCQHYDYEMSDVFFRELAIPEADYNLDVGSGTHGDQTGEMLIRIERILTREKPDLVIIYGDTNTTLAGALAAVKLYTRVAHVEAGLRSFDRSMPEEINRVIADHCSDYLFCPTATAVANLERESACGLVYLTGDVTVDVLLEYERMAGHSRILENLGLESRRYLVVTIHRQGNTDRESNLRNIVVAFLEIDEDMIFPLHPRTEKYLKTYGLYDKLHKNVRMIKPLGYLDFLTLVANARKIITDSGGVQKEAYILGVPCITLRDNTEWIETVESGWNILVGTEKERILTAVREFEPHGKPKKVFRRGACIKISRIIGQLI